MCLTGCARQGLVPRLVAARAAAGRPRRPLRDLARDLGRGRTSSSRSSSPRSRGDRRLARDLARLAEAAGAAVRRDRRPPRPRPRRACLQDAFVAIRHRLTLDGSEAERRGNRDAVLRSPAEMAALFADHPRGGRPDARLADRLRFDLTRDLGYRFPDFAGSHPGETAQAGAGARLRLPARRALPQRRQAGGRPGAPGRGARAHRPPRPGRLLPAAPRHPGAGARGGPARAPRRLGPPLAAARARAAAPRWARSSATSPASPTSTRSRTGSSWDASSTATWPRCPTSTSTSRATCARRSSRPSSPATAPSTPPWSPPSPPSASAWPSASWAARWRCPRPTWSGWCGSPTRGRPPARVEEELAAPARTARPSWPRRAGGRWRSWPARPPACPDTCHSTPVAWSSAPARWWSWCRWCRPPSPDRQICQWDKDSCADAGFVKIDLLGLGMLSAVEECVDLIARSRGESVDLSRIGFTDPEVYAEIQDADTVGVFQIESRAQMQSLLQTRPESLEDLTIQVALIRPGPVSGGAVHPYVKHRRAMRAPIPASSRPTTTRCWPTACARRSAWWSSRSRCSRWRWRWPASRPGQAEALRRAMSRKRSREAMIGPLARVPRRRPRRAGWTTRPIRTVFTQADRLLELRLPQGALGGLRGARLPERLAAAALPGRVPGRPAERPADGLLPARHPGARRPAARRARAAPLHRGARSAICTVEDGAVRDRPRATCARCARRPPAAWSAERAAGGPFRDMADLAARADLRREQLAQLVRAGACDVLERPRRAMLWELGVLARPRDGRRRRAAGPADPRRPGPAAARARPLRAHPHRLRDHRPLHRLAPGGAGAPRAAARRPHRRPAARDPPRHAASRRPAWWWPASAPPRPAASSSCCWRTRPG